MWILIVWLAQQIFVSTSKFSAPVMDFGQQRESSRPENLDAYEHIRVFHTTGGPGQALKHTFTDSIRVVQQSKYKDL